MKYALILFAFAAWLALGVAVADIVQESFAFGLAEIGAGIALAFVWLAALPGSILYARLFRS